MIFKDILVHIDNSPACAKRLEMALALAGEHKARLTGLYVITHPPRQPHGEQAKARESEAEELFRRTVGAAVVDNRWLSVDWSVVGANAADVLNYYAYSRDLVVIGQTDEGALSDEVSSDLPERVILGSGRPVLVVPYAGAFDKVGDHVIVAWKAGRASARAVSDAMPFLTRARKVSVLSIRPVGEHLQFENGTASDICEHLKLHDVAAEAENLVTGEIPVADILTNYGWENGCDLIVIGVYAYTSRGTHNIGSVAKQLLEHMTLPVLFSH